MSATCPYCGQNELSKMLRCLAERYPEWVPDEELGQETGFTPSGGTFSTYIGELRRNRLIERTKGQSRASATLMEAGM